MGGSQDHERGGVVPNTPTSNPYTYTCQKGVNQPTGCVMTRTEARPALVRRLTNCSLALVVRC